MKLSCKPNFSVLYKKTKEIKEKISDEKDKEKLFEEEKKKVNEIANIIKKLSEENIRKIKENGKLNIEGFEILDNYILIEKKFVHEFEKDKNCLSNNECGIMIDTTVNEKIMNSYIIREFFHRIQILKKEIGVKINDDIYVTYEN